MASVSDRQKEFGTDSEKNICKITSNCNSNNTPVSKLGTERSINSRATNLSDQLELESSLNQPKVWPLPVPLEGVGLSNLYTSFGSVIPHVFGAQSGLSPVASPGSANRQDSAIHVNPMHQAYDQLGESVVNSSNQMIHKVDHQKLDSVEDRGHISPTTDQSGSNSFCNGALSRLSSMGYGSASGSNSNVDQASVGRNEEGFLPCNGSSHRSMQRVAALTKFRLKRKDRCYEKKVQH